MTTVEPPSKNRNNQCKEWERNRRNKFNDAITKLGDIVIAINKAKESAEKDTCPSKNGDNPKYPKIEIIQKAILCLTNCAQEKTQLKAEILSLQVKLESTQVNNKISKKDAATQVHIEISKKSKNSKYVKLLMMQKSKRSVLKEKFKSPNENKRENAPMPKLPNILPRYNIFEKKAPENAIVVLPAAPYIFPQRPFLFPTAPPAIVLVDPNLQTLNKSVPIVSRNSGDITKTTMVNILPISAYSRPLSATKYKKNNSKLKTDAGKKVAKKSKSVEKDDKSAVKSTDDSKVKTVTQPVKESKNPIRATSGSHIVNIEVSQANKIPIVGKPTDNDLSKNNPENPKTPTKDNNNEVPVENNPKTKTDSLKPININMEEPQSLKLVDSVIAQNLTPMAATVLNKTVDSVEKPKTAMEINKSVGKPLDKSTAPAAPEEKEKEKENKLSNILDTTLCDNVVDGGNARLELAEEFLAASPTAAFLMSFPLVSGNRADSPAEEHQNVAHTQTKEGSHKRNDLIPQQVPNTSAAFLEKSNNTDMKTKTSASKTVPPILEYKPNNQQKQPENILSKTTEVKSSTAVTLSNVSNENPFLNLPMSSLISTNCTLPDTTFGLDFDCSLNKPIPSQSTGYVSNSNIFYKNDPFSTVKSTIYSTSSISSNHDFNGLGLYPCAMEKYSSKNKSDFSNIDDNNLMKIGSSRLTYDIDLGWSHKSFDFVNCTTSAATFTKDNILTSVSSTPFCTSYNPFNSEFHVPLVSSSANKKDTVSNKASSTFADTITNFYSQPSNLWSDEPFYTNANVSKTFMSKHQNYLPAENIQTNSNIKQSNVKHYEVKENPTVNINNGVKATNNSVGQQQLNENFTKKTPNKMHINWMTSEIRPMQNNCNPTHSEIKESHKLSYSHLDHVSKRQDNNESNNYFPLSMHNFPTQTPQEDFQMWPSARPLGTTEISIDPPPINLPTLVGDLALGPHEKKKNADLTNRAMPQDLQNCTNFFSVTQLMNRSSDNLSSRYHTPQTESTKTFASKQNVSHFTNDSNRKVMTSRVESHIPQPYAFTDPKLSHSYENMNHFSQSKTKSNSKSDKNSKPQKNNYSAEALLRGGNFTQKVPDNSSKFLMSSQKYGDYNNPQETGVAQVSHFPPIIDYSDNSYTGQQLSGTSLYNTTTNTISNSFYSNFMPGSSNLMSSNYSAGPFTGEFIDYNQSTECNYPNNKYEELKMRNHPPAFHSEKMPTNYKSSRRESATKHKMECSKKEPSKKYQSKRSKLNNDVDEWSDPSHALWQNKGSSSRKHPNLMSEELPFPNYVSNQMLSQYQPDLFNSHLMPSNMQAVGHNVDRSLASFPVTSRANFNLSTIFPEITMKVQ